MFPLRRTRRARPRGNHQCGAGASSAPHTYAGSAGDAPFPRSRRGEADRSYGARSPPRRFAAAGCHLHQRKRDAELQLCTSVRGAMSVCSTVDTTVSRLGNLDGVYCSTSSIGSGPLFSRSCVDRPKSFIIRIKAVSTRRSSSASAVAKRGSAHQWGPSATNSTTRCARASSPHSSAS